MPAMATAIIGSGNIGGRLAVMESDRLGIGYGPWGPPVNNRRVNGH